MKTVIELQEEQAEKMMEEARELKAKQDALAAEAQTYLQSLLAAHVALDGLAFHPSGMHARESTAVITVGIEDRRFTGLPDEKPKFFYNPRNDARYDKKQVAHLLNMLVYPPNWAKGEPSP